MKTKLITYFAIALLIFSLCACGGGNNRLPNESESDEEQVTANDTSQIETAEGSETSGGKDAVAEIKVDAELLDLLPVEKEKYLVVLEDIEEKIALDAGDVDTGRGLFCDIDGNGCAELIICYEYPEADLVFEVWTIIDEKAVPLAVVSDLGSISGAGDGGVHLVSYDGRTHLCFWTHNIAPWPPERMLNHYQVSEWIVTDGRLRAPRRMSVEFFSDSDGVDEVLASFAIWTGPMGEISEETCQEFLDRYIEGPEAVLCRSTGLDDQLGFTLTELKMQLQE